MAALSGRPDLILLDIMLPKINRFKIRRVGQDVRAWPLLALLVLVVVVAAGCVLWFMREAMQNERMAVRHSRQIIFQMAEVAVPRELFRAILEGIGRLRLSAAASG